ncbi:hypothetical protein [Niabella beijingensis]|uniref:hypothetical protein n=1 Tax=Niabella beijingensis TaxID=2872700 RepID=UPI001CBBDC71|nr:hypothetical protein [Niabella beijingensis]MBZ4190124.1 hypothetical protein [Niabella beijingensis]
MKTAEQKLGHPLFLTAVWLLLLNDWLLKPAWHNALTGKLSDIAGLFALPFFLSALFPAWRKPLHLAVAGLFIWWKSSWAQPLIDQLNAWQIPVARVVDPTDLPALISVLFSYLVFNNSAVYRLKRLALNSILVISSFAFMATSMAYRQYNFNKTYDFNCSKQKLVAAFNTLQLQYLTRFKSNLDFDSEKNVFHYKDHSDTVAYLLDYRKLKDTDTIRYRTSYCKILITGDSLKARLQLISAINYAPPPPFPWKPSPEKTIRQFEKRVVQKLKQYIKNDY